MNLIVLINRQIQRCHSERRDVILSASEESHAQGLGSRAQYDRTVLSVALQWILRLRTPGRGLPAFIWRNSYALPMNSAPSHPWTGQAPSLHYSIGCLPTNSAIFTILYCEQNFNIYVIHVRHVLQVMQLMQTLQFLPENTIFPLLHNQMCAQTQYL